MEGWRWAEGPGDGWCDMDVEAVVVVVEEVCDVGGPRPSVHNQGIY